MGLENRRTIDAAGIETSSGTIVLSILDSWTWANETQHLTALQEKLEAYLDFIEGGEVANLYADAANRRITIDVIFRVPPVSGVEGLLQKASTSCAQLGVELRSRVIPG
jgi:hypothetical protein